MPIIKVKGAEYDAKQDRLTVTLDADPQVLKEIETTLASFASAGAAILPFKTGYGQPSLSTRPFEVTLDEVTKYCPVIRSDPRYATSATNAIDNLVQILSEDVVENYANHNPSVKDNIIIQYPVLEATPATVEMDKNLVPAGQQREWSSVIQVKPSSKLAPDIAECLLANALYERMERGDNITILSHNLDASKPVANADIAANISVGFSSPDQSTALRKARNSINDFARETGISSGVVMGRP